MSSFTDPLILEAISEVKEGRGIFVVYSQFVYEVGYLGSGDKITVPKGFKTDLVSVPWFARAFVPLSGPLAKPALLHDWLLIQKDPRATAVFDEALKVAKVSNITRKLLVSAVKTWFFLKKLLRINN